MNAELIKLSEIFKEAATLESRRQVREAVEKLRSAEEIARREPVGTVMMLPAVLQQLAPLLDDLGDYGAVRTVSEEALQMAEKTFGPESRDAHRDHRDSRLHRWEQQLRAGLRPAEPGAPGLAQRRRRFVTLRA